ncbi:hypothetical protein CHUAL_012066 [Chamberlinius hualienensis]
MTTLLEALKPFNLVLLCYGIDIEKPKSTKKLKMATKIIFKLIWFLLQLNHIFCIIYTLHHFRIYIPKGNWSSRWTNLEFTTQIISDILCTIVYFNVQYKTTITDYGKILKDVILTKKEHQNLKTKLKWSFGALFLAIAIVLYCLYEHLSWHLPEISMDLPSKTELEIFLNDRTNWIIINWEFSRFCYKANLIFTGFACQYLNLIANFVSNRMDLYNSRLRMAKSAYRRANIAKLAMEEYGQLAKLAKSMDNLLSKWIYLFFWTEGKSIVFMIESIIPNFFLKFDNYVRSSIIMMITDIKLFYVVVSIAYIVQSTRSNRRSHVFIGQLLAGQIRPEDELIDDLNSVHIDQLIWTTTQLKLNKSEFNQWFTVGFGLTFNMGLFLAISQTFVGMFSALVSIHLENKF